MTKHKRIYWQLVAALVGLVVALPLSLRDSWHMI
jgi:hypothetical protein